jgi:hypothetical protein
MRSGGRLTDEFKLTQMAELFKKEVIASESNV